MEKVKKNEVITKIAAAREGNLDALVSEEEGEKVYRSEKAAVFNFCYTLPMIAKLTGIVSDIGPRYVVIDVGGIGYKVFVTDDVLHSLKKSKEISLLTHLAVREDALDLYGFLSKKEKEFFELLITISGIGPKSALNILSLVTADTLSASVRSGSVAHLVKVSGIGKKTAEKIVLELKDKLGGMESGGDFTAGMSSDVDAIEALKALGYDADEAREALKKVSKDISDIGDKVKAALKELGK